MLDAPGLQVPHPRFRERFFVLGPLAEVAPDMVDPVTGLEGVGAAAEIAGGRGAVSAADNQDRQAVEKLDAGNAANKKRPARRAGSTGCLRG